jgi:putative FmdB family regulatory protein
MPIYPYRCDKCGQKWDSFHSVDTRGDENCRICKVPAIREIAALQARPQIIEEYSTQLGEYITGPAHKRKVMREKGLEEVGRKEIESGSRKWM